MDKQKEIAHITRTYKLVYRLVFILGLPIVSFAISVFILTSIQDQTVVQEKDQSRRTDTMKQTEQEIAKKLSEQKAETTNISGSNDTSINMLLYNGYFSQSGNYIISENNLLTYKNMLLPKMITLSKTLPFQQKAYFSQPNYKISHLEHYLTHAIFQDFVRQNTQTTETTESLLTLPQNKLLEYFGLTCLDNADIHNEICRYYVVDFIEVLPVYNLANNYQGLQKVAKTLYKDPTLQERFCEQLQTYITYSYDTNVELVPIMQQCDKKYTDYYERARNFFLAQKDISSNTPSSVVVADKDVNAYKLISLQQKIYQQIQQQRMNHAFIALYLQFVERLLQQQDSLDHVYKDLIFLFNNKYLTTKFADPAFNNTLSNKEQVTMLADHVRKINKGDTLKGYVGLSEQVFNKELLSLIDGNVDGEATQAEKITLLDRFHAKFSFPHYHIHEDKQINSSTIRTRGNLYISIENEETQKIPTSITFTFHLGKFLVQEVLFEQEEYQTLNKVMKKILKNTNMTLPQLYTHIEKNIAMFQQEQKELGFCDFLVESFGKELTLCTNKQIDITTKSGKQITTYSFLHTSGNLHTISLTNKDLQEKVLTEFSGMQTNIMTIGIQIKQIVEYVPPVEKKEIPNDTTESMRISIANDFQEYLETETEAIYTQDETTFVVFTLRNVTFIAEYDIAGSQIDNLYFKDLGSQHTFKDFNLALSEDNFEDVYTFKNDPLQFLATINPKTVLLYKEHKEQE